MREQRPGDRLHKAEDVGHRRAIAAMPVAAVKVTKRRVTGATTIGERQKNNTAVGSRLLRGMRRWESRLMSDAGLEPKGRE